VIFRQVAEIVSGEKTETRRVCKPNEVLDTYPVATVFTVAQDMPMPPRYKARRRVKWQVGRNYAVIPKRGQPAVWIHPMGMLSSNESIGGMTIIAHYRAKHGSDYQRVMVQDGWAMLRYTITDLHREPLHAITGEGAKREGVGSVAEYEALWRSINDSPGVRWEDNPDVWVIRFKVGKSA